MVIKLNKPYLLNGYIHIAYRRAKVKHDYIYFFVTCSQRSEGRFIYNEFVNLKRLLHEEDFVEMTELDALFDHVVIDALTKGIAPSMKNLSPRDVLSWLYYEW